MKNLLILISLCVLAFGCDPNTSKDVIEISVPELAKDVASGSLLYEEKTVKIRGIVSRVESAPNEYISIDIPNQTLRQRVSIIIFPHKDKKQDFSQYIKDRTYTFTVFISKIELTKTQTRLILCVLFE